MQDPTPEPNGQDEPESIQSKGGKARAKKLTPEEKSAIGKKAIEARWANRPVPASHRGNFLEEFGFDVECYVLDDDQKTAVISQSGMGKTLGMTPRGNAFPRFIESRTMSPFVSAELRDKLSQPLKIQWGSGGAEQPPSVINGFDVTLLTDVCKAILDAESTLGPRHSNIVRQAKVILSASSKLGIKHLVYALAGFSPTKESVIDAFKLYVREEAKKYEKEFPPELYREWFRLYKIPKIVGRGWPWEFKALTVRHVYTPLARSNGKILELTRALKAKGGDRNKKLFQFLSDVGARALSRHLGRVVEMAEDSPDRATYEKRITKRFGDQQELDLD